MLMLQQQNLRVRGNEHLHPPSGVNPERSFFAHPVLLQITQLL
jgi:hypothetical protein